MKIISKTYLLVGILIAAAIVNLYLLYQVQQVGTAESYSIIRAGDLKVKTETISSLASSIASGNVQDREILKQEINDFELVLTALKNGGTIRGQSIVTVPDQVSNYYNDVFVRWEEYRDSANNVQQTSVFDQNVVAAVNYVLGKSAELILTAHTLSGELEGLDRNYNRHKEIAAELEETAKKIGQHTLLLSIGEEEGVQEQLKQDKLLFEIGIRKLLQIPLDGLDLKSVNAKAEQLDVIPRENSASLRQLDPLWEAVRLRVSILEEKSLLSPDFQSARENLQTRRFELIDAIDSMLDAWNEQLNTGKSQQQVIVQILIGVDVMVFLAVIFVIRHSLNPLQLISNALSRVREGIYGEKIDYQSQDEVGELVNSFNIMSGTIKQKEEEARKMDIAKDEFLAMITHELKTPLVPIQGYADLLLSEHVGKLTTKQKERLSIIKSSASSLLQLISDLLDAQKLELGQLRMKTEEASIKKTIENAVESLKPQADQNEVKISVAASDVTMMHDPERIGQVLTNLIKNSLNAVKPKIGIIEIILQNNPTEVAISVKDNGIGIPLDKQKDLFKKFYQVDASLTRERGGSGLGLAICKGIVEWHGGKIKVQSAPNVGSTFTFTLPKSVTPLE